VNQPGIRGNDAQYSRIRVDFHFPFLWSKEQDRNSPLNKQTAAQIKYRDMINIFI